MHLLFNNDEIKILRTKFRNLTKVRDKLSFWENDLQINYLLRYSDQEKYLALKEFAIIIETDSERKELNDYVLKNYSKAFAEKVNAVLDFNNLKKELSNKLKLKKDKLEVLNNENKRIDDSFAKDGFYKMNNKNEQLFDANHEVFLNRLKYGQVPDLAKVRNPVDVVGIHNGCQLAEYKQYVENEIKKYSKKRILNDIETLTLNQSVLLLEYYGVWDSLKCDISEKARLFENYLPSESSKRIYESIRLVKDENRKNKDDLKAILVFIEKNDLRTIQSPVQTDLDILCN